MISWVYVLRPLQYFRMSFYLLIYQPGNIRKSYPKVFSCDSDLTLILYPGAFFGTWHDFVSLIMQRWSYLQFQSPSRFGHKSTLYNPEPKKFQNFKSVWVTEVVMKWSKRGDWIRVKFPWRLKLNFSLINWNCFFGYISSIE